MRLRTIKSTILRRLGAGAVGVAVLALAAWLFVNQPWQREVWVTTTMEAFSGPGPGEAFSSFRDGKVYLIVGLTPAPWPDEARTIWSAARRGKRVHITVLRQQGTLRFDADGTTSDGNLLVPCASAGEANRLAGALGFY